MDRNDAATWARDAAYTAVGFCVLGIQHLQVTRRELASDIGARTGGDKPAPSRSGVAQIVKQAEAVVDPVLNGVERVLPGTARTAMQQGRTAAKVLRKVLL